MAGWREELHPRDPANGEFIDQSGAGHALSDWATKLAHQMGFEGGHGQIWYGDVQVDGKPLPDPGYDDTAATALDQRGQGGVRDWIEHDGAVADQLNRVLRSGGDLSGTAKVEDWDLEDGQAVYDAAGNPRMKTVHEVGLQQIRDDLRHAIDQGHLTSDAVLWRGVALSRADAEKMFQPGAVVADRGFSATSMNREHAEGMLGLRIGRGQEPYLLRMMTPKGTHVAPGAAAVSEMVLRDGLRYRVISHQPPAEDDYVPGIITVEVLP